MAVRKVLQQNDPALHQVNQAVNPSEIRTPKITEAIADLIETMRDSELIAMAAPQIGIFLNIFVTEIRATKYRTKNDLDELRIFINPKIISQSAEQIEIYEGCGSVSNPTRFGPVIRSSTITVSAQNEKGESFELKCNGLLARAIQHEVDHLNGLEFTDRMPNSTKLISAKDHRAIVNNSPDHQNAIKTTIKEISFSTSHKI